MKTFEELLDDKNYIELTEGRNNYPKNISKAIFQDNFDSWEEMKEFADENELEVINIHSKDGWHFWENKGTAYKPLLISADDFGDNYSEFSKMSEADFFEQEIHPVIENFNNFEDLEKMIEAKKEIFEEIENMEDDEIVISYDGDYFETWKQNPLSFYHDTHKYSFALIPR